MTDSIPPNEKVWTEEHRDLIHDRLPGHMKLGETSDMRVGKWFPVEVGGVIKISKIGEETEVIRQVFADLGVDVCVPLVGVSHEGHEYVPMQAYLVEIENWQAREDNSRARG